MQLFNRQTIIWRPLALTLALHALLIVSMSLNWSMRSEVTEPAPLVPKYIKARLIDAESLRPKPKKTRKTAPKVAAKPAPKVKAAPKPQPKPVAQPKVAPAPAPVVVEDDRPSAEEQIAAARDELSQALAAEDELLTEASDSELAASYIGLISQSVQNNWSRPPSARNGMEVELIIQLVPTGEVVSVTVARSSGQMAFDRSAVNAVQKAARFDELQQLPSRVFERSFRQFRLLFKPEDLRY